jgi:predicted amidophosphoribosyltransferase
MWRRIRPWLFPVWCAGCGEPDEAFCCRCAATARPFGCTVGAIVVHAAGDYDGALRDAILALKRGERAFLDPLAALVAPLVPEGAAIVPLRTSRRRAAARGFDQSYELARRVAELRGGWVDDVIRKRGGAQHGRTRDERFGASGRFRIRTEAEVPSAAVVLDDVLTTGATLRDAIAELTAAGCWVSGGAVLARTPPGRETSRSRGRLVEA